MDPPSCRAVFLSYAHEDAEVARRIAEGLRQAGIEVWFDQSELRGGDLWDATIRRQIRGCALFVPIISQRTQARREGYFRREWKFAVDRCNDMAEGTPFVVPVCVDPIQESDALVPEPFRAIQWTTLTRDAVPRAFVDRVRVLLGEPAAMPVAVTRPDSVVLTVPRSTERPVPPGKSIAVLAFENRSNDPENEYFSDGVSEDLLNVLAKIPGMRVAARTSAFSFKGQSVPVPEIARRLNVAHVVEGSVRKSGNRVRITVQLVNAVDGFQEWSETFDRELGDVFALQDDVTRTIVRALQPALTAEVGDPPGEGALAFATRGGTRNGEAYRLYLQAKYIGNQLNRDAMERAIDLYRQAVELDSSFALAWAALGRAYVLQLTVVGSSTLTIARASAFARGAVERALSLDPDLPEAHATLMTIQTMYEFDWAAAEESGRRAVELAPANAVILTNMMFLAIARGELDVGTELARRTVELDPVSSEATMWLMFAFIWVGRLADAEAEARRVIELSPVAIWAYAGLALTYFLRGRMDEAATAAERQPEDYSRHSVLAMIAWTRGRRTESDETLRKLIEVGSLVAAYQIAWVYAHRGEVDAAFSWLDRAYQQRDPGMLYVKGDPFLRMLHGDPRWAELLARMRMDA